MSEPTESEPLPEDELDPNEAEIAWAKELESRIEDVRTGRVKLVSGAELSAKVEAILDDRRHG